MTLQDIYISGGRLITDLIRKEFVAQGHSLTGNAERSIESRIVGNTLSGFAVAYITTIDEGLDASKISMKMVPALTAYFLRRGVPMNEAPRAAILTVKKWLREGGMPTQASKRFSKTGNRKNFVESAFMRPEIDNYFESSFDFAIDEEYHKTKSETI